MSYTATVWKNNEAPALNADNLNKLEQAMVAASEPVSYNDLLNKPTLLTIGTTATTAKAGNYTPSVGDIPSLPTSKITSGTFAIAQIPTGTTSTTVSLGNHTHTATQITASVVGTGTATNVQGILQELAARIAALETP